MRDTGGSRGGVRCSAVQQCCAVYGAVRCGAVQCGTVLCGTRCGAMWVHAWVHGAVRYDAVWYGAAHGVVRGGTMSCSAVWCRGRWAGGREHYSRTCARSSRKLKTYQSSQAGRGVRRLCEGGGAGLRVVW